MDDFITLDELIKVSEKLPSPDSIKDMFLKMPIPSERLAVFTSPIDTNITFKTATFKKLGMADNKGNFWYVWSPVTPIAI